MAAQTATQTRTFNLDRAVMLFDSIVTLASVVLTVALSHWWLLLTTFIGLKMLQASITGFCPAAVVMKRLGVQSGQAFK
jgi:hypothetical protein